MLHGRNNQPARRHMRFDDGRREIQQQDALRAEAAFARPLTIMDGHRAIQNNMREMSPANTALRRGTKPRKGGQDGYKTESEKPATDTKKGIEQYNPKLLARNSENILSQLKLHYLRTRSIERATSFLYGNNTEGMSHGSMCYHS